MEYGSCYKGRRLFAFPLKLPALGCSSGSRAAPPCSRSDRRASLTPSATSATPFASSPSRTSRTSLRATTTRRRAPFWIRRLACPSATTLSTWFRLLESITGRCREGFENSDG